jgi:pimeloyl-ACP methyl ester carboxylesterase
MPALAATLPLKRRSLVELGRRDLQAARERVRRECASDLAALAHDADRWLDDWAQTAPAPDGAVVADPEIRRMYIESVREARLEDYAHEAELLWLRSWGFAPAQIAVPTVLWHGELDDAVPVAVARGLAAEIPRCEARIALAEGHLLVHSHAEEILGALSR